MTSYRLTGPLRGTDLAEVWIVDGAIRHSAPDSPAQTVAGWAYPGLVDAHAHPGLSHSAEPVADAEVIRRLDAARAAGVTTVREMGAQLDVARFAARGRTKAIRSGRHIARPKRYIRNVAAEIEPGELPDEVVRQAARGDGWVKLVGDWIDRTEGADSDLRPLWPRDVLADAVAAATGSSATRSAAYRYETVRINKSPYLVGGIDVDAVRALNGHWEIEGRWPGDGEVLIGLDVAESTGFKVGSTVNAEYLGSDDLSLSSTVSSSGDTAQAAGQASWRVSGIVDTGGSEDDILYVPLGQLETLTGNADAGYDVVEFSVDTTSVTAADVADAVNRAADAAGQGVRAEPVSKITSGDTRIITMLDTLFWVVAVVVLGLTLVGVSTTMTVIVSERRNEIGLRKALGASSRSIAVEFYTEAACLGLIGGLIGTAIGYALARAVGIGVFEQPIGFSWWLALLSVLLSALVAVIASAGPVQGATRIDPALVLREE